MEYVLRQLDKLRQELVQLACACCRLFRSYLLDVSNDRQSHLEGRVDLGISLNHLGSLMLIAATIEDNMVEFHNANVCVETRDEQVGYGKFVSIVGSRIVDLSIIAKCNCQCCRGLDINTPRGTGEMSCLPYNHSVTNKLFLISDTSVSS